MNTRLALACTAVGALAAGAALAQATYYPAPHIRCDQTDARARYACESRYRERHAYRNDRYATGYYRDGTYFPAYDDSDSYGPYGQEPGYADQGYYDQGYYAPAPSADEYGAPAAYESESSVDVAPVYVPARRFWWERPGDTSPGAQYSVRLHGYVNPHSSVTAIPTPNNVSDQIPSHGPDYDGVPSYYPY